MTFRRLRHVINHYFLLVLATCGSLSESWAYYAKKEADGIMTRGWGIGVQGRGPQKLTTFRRVRLQIINYFWLATSGAFRQKTIGMRKREATYWHVSVWCRQMWHMFYPLLIHKARGWVPGAWGGLGVKPLKLSILRSLCIDFSTGQCRIFERGSEVYPDPRFKKWGQLTPWPPGSVAIGGIDRFVGLMIMEANAS